MSDTVKPLDSSKLEIQSKPLFTPPLQSLAEGKKSNFKKTYLILTISLSIFAALKGGLQKNFREVKVDVVSCPDLRNEPFDLASEGK